MMRAAAFLICTILIAGCAGPRLNPAWEAPITIHLETTGLTVPGMFDLSRVWLARNLNSDKRIIEYENRPAGIFVANGTVDYPATGIEAVVRIQFTISFRLTVQTDAQGISLTFDTFSIYVPKNYDRRAELWFGREYFGGYSRPPVSREEYAAAGTAVSGVADGLRRYLESEAAGTPKSE